MSLIVRIFFLFFGIVFCLCSSANEIYYKTLAADAIQATVNYYALYLDCLQKEEITDRCSKDKKNRSQKYVDNVAIVSAGMLNRYGVLYPNEKVSLAKNASLESSRKMFYREVISLQRKLLIFMALTGKMCGRPDIYDVSKDVGEVLMDFYVKGLSMRSDQIRIENIKYYNDYETLIKGEISKDMCNFYLQENSLIWADAYSILMEAVKKSSSNEVDLVYFVDVLIVKMINAESHFQEKIFIK